ncbi:hypothetical protein J1N35_001277 [Gossypium stocksii]|uniref:Uncharacterized protein n=1 Tax=Gossypium stocksii TaxID=47602 RepID=A0A9D3WJT8_9ROSI|nr:hypothetical protein J1N35_001277 [Gossypium stocksii]
MIIVLSCKKLKTFLDTKCPPATQAEAKKHWEKSDEIAHCYMLTSVTNTQYKQLESYKTAKAIIDKLEDMFGSQAATTSLINA